MLKISGNTAYSARKWAELAEEEPKSLPEQRRDRRYDLEVPVRVIPASWAGALKALSKDFSAHGVYLVLNQELELGSMADMEITLPPDWPGRACETVFCLGKVKRLEPRNTDGRIGLGAELTDFDFIQILKAMPNYSYKLWMVS